MIADAIKALLNSEDKKSDPEALLSFVNRMGWRAYKQFMASKESRQGFVSTTTVSGKCALKAWKKFQGVPERPLDAETILNFWLGDIFEAMIIMLAPAAGVKIVDNNRQLSLRPNIAVVHPDGRYEYEPGKWRNVEIKKVSSYGMEKAHDGGPGDEFGYLTQASIGIAAWREAGYGIDETEFVLCCADTREIASFLVAYDNNLVEDARLRAELALLGPKISPPDSLPTEKETAWNPSTRTKEETGRNVLCLQCRFCGYRAECWPTAIKETTTKKIPIPKELTKWIVPKQ